MRNNKFFVILLSIHQLVFMAFYIRQGPLVPLGRRLCSLLAAVAVMSALLPSLARATDLLYVLQSPAFGGTNPAALQAAEYDKSLAAQRAASIAAAAAAATAANPNQQFANAIVSQLNSLVARDVALKIAGSSNGDAGTIQSGGDSVTYVNSDGQLNIVINTPTGSTTVNLPSGN
jgi:hypothetical protein